MEVHYSLFVQLMTVHSDTPVTVGGHAYINGTLVVNFDPGFHPKDGDVIDVIHHNGTSGNFSGVIINNPTQECTVVTSEPKTTEHSYSILLHVTEDKGCKEDSSQNNDWIWITIGVVVGCVVLIAIITLSWFYYRRIKTM